jgi:hypothetical protein
LKQGLLDTLTTVLFSMTGLLGGQVVMFFDWTVPRDYRWLAIILVLVMTGNMRRDIQCLIILWNLVHTNIILMIMTGHISFIHLTIYNWRESLLTVELIKLVLIIKGIGINFTGRVLYNFGSQPFFHLEFHMIPPDKIEIIRRETLCWKMILRFIDGLNWQCTHAID